jgi:hypothetical protein
MSAVAPMAKHRGAGLYGKLGADYRKVLEKTKSDRILLIVFSGENVNPISWNNRHYRGYP